MVIIQPLEPCKNYTFDVAAMSKSGYLGPLAERNKATLESGEWCHRRKITGFMVYRSVDWEKNVLGFVFCSVFPWRKERKTKTGLKRWLDSRIETYWNPPFIDLITKKREKKKHKKPSSKHNSISKPRNYPETKKKKPTLFSLPQQTPSQSGR